MTCCIQLLAQAEIFKDTRVNEIVIRFMTKMQLTVYE